MHVGYSAFFQNLSGRVKKANVINLKLRNTLLHAPPPGQLVRRSTAYGDTNAGNQIH